MEIKLCHKKEPNKKSSKYIEIDLLDLETYFDFKETDEYNDIPSKKIGGKSLIEWFAIDDISYWWLISANIFPRFNEGVLFVERFLNLIKDKNPSCIILESFFDKYSLIEQICKKNNIQLKVNYRKKILFDFKLKFTEYIKPIRYRKILKKKEKKRFSIYNQKNNFPNPPNDYTLVTGINRRLNLPTINGEIKKQDFIVQPIIDLLKINNKPLLCVDLDYTSNGTTEFLSERLDTDVDWVPIEFFTHNPMSKKTKFKIKQLQNNIQLMIKNNMDEVFNYHGISLWPLLKSSFSDVSLDPYLPIYIHQIEKLEEFFSKHRPRVIIQAYEVGSLAKVFEIAAKKFNIKTIGIQHGILNEPEHDYMHKEIYSRENPLGNPIPDSTFVFGEYYKKILITDGSYQSDQLIVTGNPSWHQTETFKKIFNHDQILKNYNIFNKKIILIPLSFRIAYAKNNVSDRIVLNKIYESMGTQKDLIVIVRPHPGDEFDQTTLDRLYPNSNFKCSQASLVEDLIISDIVLITYSTVALEAAMFKKPVIYVNFNKTKKSQTYSKTPSLMIENGIALSATLEEIKDTINNIFEKKWVYDYNSKRDSFLKYFINYGEEVDMLKIIYQKTQD
jgi:hypothetical protein